MVKWKRVAFTIPQNYTCFLRYLSSNRCWNLECTPPQKIKVSVFCVPNGDRFYIWRNGQIWSYCFELQPLKLFFGKPTFHRVAIRFFVLTRFLPFIIKVNGRDYLISSMNSYHQKNFKTWLTWRNWLVRMETITTFFSWRVTFHQITFVSRQSLKNHHFYNIELAVKKCYF